MSYLTDPDLPQAPLGMPGLSPADQQALAARENPQNVLTEYQAKHAAETAHIDAIELQRIQAENAQMRAEVGDTRSQLQTVQSGYDNLSGQLTAMQMAQQNQAARAAAEQQYAYSQDDLDNHGDLLPLIEKANAKTRYEMEQDFARRLAAEKAQWAAETTAPIQAQLHQTQQQLQIQAQRSQAEFAGRMQKSIADLGLGSIDELTRRPEFMQRYNQPVAPGVSIAWGDQLKQNIENQKLYEAEAMLRDLRDSSPSLRPRVDQEVPAGSTPARPLTSTQSANLQQREQLTAQYAARQEDANVGVFPRGWDRARYRSEQEKLKAQIDSIPTT